MIERLRTSEDLDVGTTIVTRIEILRGRIDYVLKAETGNLKHFRQIPGLKVENGWIEKIAAVF